MLRRVAIAVAACGGGAPKPAEPQPVAEVKTSPCSVAADALVKPLALDASQVDTVRVGLDEACQQTRWPDAYVACIGGGTTPCEDTRTPRQKTEAHRVMVMVLLPQECTQFISVIEALAQCERIPKASRDAMKQRLDAMTDSWDFWAMTPDKRKAVIKASGEACLQGIDSVAQGAKAAGC